MEPNTQTQSTPTPAPNKNKKMLIIIVIIILVIIAAILMKSKVIAPVDVNNVENSVQGDSILNADIDAATTFDNEADLKEIDTAFE